MKSPYQLVRDDNEMNRLRSELAFEVGEAGINLLHRNWELTASFLHKASATLVVLDDMVQERLKLCITERFNDTP